MKSLAFALALSTSLVAIPSFAQQTAPARPPAQAAPAAAPAAQAPADVPFVEGSKLAYLDIQRIAGESAEGRSAQAKAKALNDKKLAELGGKQKQLTDAQEKLQKGGAVLNDATRGALEKDIERLQLELQRATQDAQAEMQELQKDLQNDFQRKLMPVIDAVAKEKGVQLVLTLGESGLIWWAPGLDLTPDVIKRFDQVVAAPAAAPKK